MLGNEGDLLALFDAFFRDLPPRLDSMHEGLKTRQPELIDVAAHAVRGASANLGATAVCRLAGQLEISARDEDFGPVGRLLARLEAEICRLRKHLMTSGLD